MDKLLIIDGSALLSTQFYGNMPREIMMARTPEEKEKYFYKLMKTSKGVYTNAVYGFLRTLFNIAEKQAPKYLAVAWDLTRDTFRRELYPDYKANRSETLAPLKEQFALCQDVLSRMGIKQFMDLNYEADDFAGSLSAKFENDVDVAILTKDRDYLQLVDDKVNLWLIVNDDKKVKEYFKKYSLDENAYDIPDKTIPIIPETVEPEFGAPPSGITSLKGLMGDASDNIKGVPGIGEKTALALISKYKTVDGLYDALHSASDLKALAAEWKEELGITRNPCAYLLKESDEETVGEKAARLSEKLATIKRDIDIKETLEDLVFKLDGAGTREVLDELEFDSLSVPGEKAEDNSLYADMIAATEIIDNIGILDEAAERITASFDCGKLGLELKFEDGDIYEAGIVTGTGKWLVRCEGFINPDMIRELAVGLVKKAGFICSFDVKSIMKLAEGNYDYFDASLAAYLLDPNAKEYDAALVMKLLGIPAVTKGEESVLRAYLAYDKTEELLKLLADSEMLELYNTIEKPLVPVLASMETAGIICEEEELKRQGEAIESARAELEKEIYGLAGESFNILSPKQLGEILFGKLGLPGGKKNKSGYSTSADVLEKLSEEHEIVKKVLDYRFLSKLMSTYVTGLSTCIEKDGRIHPTFNQTVTSTGRLSCTEPNLQNIPVREELGRQIRKAFVPDEGHVFVDADYSQIELRIMAHMSGDENLIDDYKNSRDIHQSTAAKVFGVPYDEVTPAQRRGAKAVNFGIIYGISSFGLGQDLDITRAEANEYINSYFKHYPTIKKYLDGLVASAKDKGYALSLYNRRRPIPELASTNFMQRSFGERAAMNMPIQGTAADIMKLAMIRVYNALKEGNFRARMILQIHDEIVIEAPEEEKDEVAALLIREMKAAAELKVELEVSSGVAYNWYDLK